MKILLKILLILCLLSNSAVAWAAVSEYVCVTPDGSNPSVDGEYSAAYPSLATWEAAEQNDLSVENGGTHHICHVIGDWSGTADVANCTIASWITDNSYRIEILAPAAVRGGVTDSARHSGVSDFTKYKHIIHAVTATNNIYLAEDYVRIDGIQLLNECDSAANHVIFVTGQVADNDVRLSNLLICKDANVDLTNGNGIYPNDAQLNLLIYNCLIWQRTDGNIGKEDGIYILYSSGISIFNCGIYGWDDGIDMGTGSIWVKNTFVYNNIDDFNDFDGIVTGVSDHCASDDGDGTNPVAPGVWDNNFVDRSGTSNFKLIEDSNLDDSGTDDPSGGIYLTDIEGDVYVSPWPVGFHEPETGGAPAAAPKRIPPQIIEWNHKRFAGNI